MNNILKALEKLKNRAPVVLVDDETRENEGDLIIPSECITEEVISFMMNECRGLICIAITEERRQELGLALQVVHNESMFGTNFAVPFDFAAVQEWGVTAKGRTQSILEASKKIIRKQDFVSPGFVVPVVAREGGVLRRRGQTEGSIDLARLAGFYESAVICEILNADGEILRGNALKEFCENHDLLCCSVEELVEYRKNYETNLRFVCQRTLSQIEPIREKLLGNWGVKNPNIEFKVKVFVDDIDNSEHFAIAFGDMSVSSVLCRIHSECLTGDVFGSLRCDCGPQLDLALEKIVENGSGLLIYLQQEGRGIGLANKIKAYQLQEEGLDTFQANEKLGFLADARDYRAASQILKIIGVDKVSLLTNNPRKIKGLVDSGIEVSARIPIQSEVNPENEAYLRAKAQKMGHLLEF